MLAARIRLSPWPATGDTADSPTWQKQAAARALPKMAETAEAAEAARLIQQRNKALVLGAAETAGPTAETATLAQTAFQTELPETGRGPLPGNLERRRERFTAAAEPEALTTLMPAMAKEEPEAAETAETSAEIRLPVKQIPEAAVAAASGTIMALPEVRASL